MVGRAPPLAHLVSNQARHNLCGYSTQVLGRNSGQKRKVSRALTTTTNRLAPLSTYSGRSLNAGSSASQTRNTRASVSALDRRGNQITKGPSSSCTSTNCSPVLGLNCAHILLFKGNVHIRILLDAAAAGIGFTLRRRLPDCLRNRNKVQKPEWPPFTMQLTRLSRRTFF